VSFELQCGQRLVCLCLLISAYTLLLVMAKRLAAWYAVMPSLFISSMACFVRDIGVSLLVDNAAIVQKKTT